MSFIKNKDPRRREELIKDLIETRKRIKDNFIARKVGESEYQTGLTKLFKPVTETQKATAKEITEAQKATAEKITSELLPIKESLEKIPAITFPDFPAVEMTKEERKKFLGPIASEALEKYTTIEGADKIFGMIKKDKKYYIGDKPIKLKDDNIIIDDKVYPGTPGLWELIISPDPQEGEITDEDYNDYVRILKQTNAIYQKNDPNTKKPRSSKSNKWKKLISPIWEDIKKRKAEAKDEEDEDPQPSTSGTGLTILPSDPNALIDRFDLLFSSQNAGHTGVRNELVSILDVLKSQGVINTKEYKKLNSIIQGFKRQYAFGGTGIFDTIGNIVSGIVTSKAGKDLAKFALDTSKNIAKTTASDIGNRLVKKVLTPKSKSIISKHTRTLDPNDAVKINELVRKLNMGMGIKKI